VVVQPKIHYPLMSEMNSSINENNGVNGAGTSCEGATPGRCSPAQQRDPVVIKLLLGLSGQRR